MPMLRFQFLMADSLLACTAPVRESTQFMLIRDTNRTSGGTAGYFSGHFICN